MIRIVTEPEDSTTPDGHVAFLALVPAIHRRAWMAFRHLSLDARQDATQEVVANAFVAFARLVSLGKVRLAYPTPLARYGIAQVRQGRRVGNRLRIGDALSRYAQKMKGFTVRSLDCLDSDAGRWRELVLADRRTPPCEQAAFRIDFSAWLSRHSQRKRQMVVALAVGNTTREVAEQFQLSQARIGQLRREFRTSWEEFHGDAPEKEARTAAAGV
jgi:hypothetical protein